MAIPKKCKVSVLVEPKKMELLEVAIPAIGPDEILVKVEGCGICGTDVHEYKGDPFKYCPVQLGHEGTGEIVALGKNVKKDYTGKPLKVGDKIVTGLKPCGTCDTCKFHPEIAELCNNGEIFGLLPGPKHYLNGWFGEYMKVNKGGVVFNVSDMDRDLRILIEPAAVIVHAVEQAKQIFDFKFNSSVLVQGCGPIGLLLLTMVRCLGVRNIIACDGDEKRLAFAKKLGAKYTVNGMKPGAVEKVQALTGGEGAEMVFQCTGSPKAASIAWKYVRRGGSFCELGFFTNNGETTYSPHLDMCNKQVKACGSWTYQAKDWVQAFDFLKEAKERKLPIGKLITHKYPLAKMNEAMEMNISMKGLKIAFTPTGK
jgi:L-iditol 2-dehydrogenase